MNKKINMSNFKYRYIISSFLSFSIPLVICILTLQPKIIGGQSSWYALNIAGMEVLPPTGYPLYSLISKLFTLIPVGDLAYKMNLFSAISGAFTILLLFFTTYLLIKDEIISLVISLTFAFITPFWSIANRIETVSFDLCFIILAIYASIRYSEQINRKNLYQFFFCLGLSLTNNQLNYYVMPVFLIYVILLNPGIFKNIKVIIFCILLFILPIFSYSYIFFRSIQGYGAANNFLSFIYYMFGRLPDGSIYTGSLPFKTIGEAYKIFLLYMEPFYKNFGLFLFVTSFGGFIYLVKKNLKFAIFSFLFIIVNFYIIIQYFDGPVISYLLPVYIILSIYSSYFLLLIKNIILIFIKKLFKNIKNIKTQNYIYCIPITVILLLMLIQPVIVASINYKHSNNSKLDEAYIAWNKILTNIENDSYLFVSSKVSNVGTYINSFEQKEREIKFISHDDKDYSLDIIAEFFDKGNKVYIIGNEQEINKKVNFENTELNFHLKKMDEILSVKKITGKKTNLELSYNFISAPKNTSDKFTLELIIINNNNSKVKINSLELKLPQNIKLLGVDKKGYFKQIPGFAQAKFMWVGDSYFVDANSKVNLILNLKMIDSIEDTIRFRITTQGIASDYLDIVINP